MPVDNSPLFSLNGKEPSILPNEIVLSSGFTRTNPETFTDGELKDAGYTGPYYYPEVNLETHTVKWIPEELKFVLEEIPVEELTDEEIWRDIRTKRNWKLIETDWCLNEDSPLSAEQKQEVKQYRQNLRDLPLSAADPKNIIFPLPPTFLL